MLSLNSDARFPRLEQQELSETCFQVFWRQLVNFNEATSNIVPNNFFVCLQGYSALTLYEAAALPENPVGRKIAAHSVTAGPGVKAVQAPVAQ